MAMITHPDGSRHHLPPEEAYLFAKQTPRRLAGWASLHDALFPDPTLPGHAWEEQVASYLFDRGYHPDSIVFVLEDARAWGTVELSRDLAFCDFDRRVVERLLPEAPEGTWSNPAYAGYWTTGHA